MFSSDIKKIFFFFSDKIHSCILYCVPVFGLFWPRWTEKLGIIDFLENEDSSFLFTGSECESELSDSNLSPAQ